MTVSETSATRSVAPELSELVRDGCGEKRAILLLTQDGDDSNGDDDDDIRSRR